MGCPPRERKTGAPRRPQMRRGPPLSGLDALLMTSLPWSKSARWPRLSPGSAHVPADRGFVVPPVDNEVMAFRLPRDRGTDRVLELGIRGPRPQQRPEFRRILLAQTHIKRAGAGQPDAVAAFAEIMG